MSLFAIVYHSTCNSFLGEPDDILAFELSSMLFTFGLTCTAGIHASDMKLCTRDGIGYTEHKGSTFVI